jgi:16S rRNA (cytosine1402-N4)-methyltransferase
MENDPKEKPKRRVRYKGSHPRRFHEKYKELNPDLYPEEIIKVKDSGKTPAGTHRPICLKEILEILDLKPGHRVVDATLGYGGHTEEILKRIIPNGKVFGFDIDGEELPKTESRLKNLGYSPDNFMAFHANFSKIPSLLKSVGITKVQSLLADLGVSSMQLDNPKRGFSFKVSGPLDLRLNPKGDLTGEDFLKQLTKRDLVEILEENSDEIFAEEIAEGIVRTQRQKPIKTTEDLTQTIQEALSKVPLRFLKDQGNRPVRRVFQALRIAINDEFQVLDTFLENLPGIVVSGGKIAILTFHSGEDRRVKKAFKEGMRVGFYKSVARDVIRPSSDEIYSNPRASSAKLRWAIKK